MRASHLLLSIMSGVWIAFPLAAATYYVSPSGNDSANGTTTSTPWKTIAKVNSLNFAAGDSILFKGGATFFGSLYFDAADAGVSLNRITVGSYEGGRATIQSGSSYGLYIYNSEGFHIKDLILQGGGAGINTARGIDLYTDLVGRRRGFRVSNVEISGYHGAVNGTSLLGGEGISILGWRGDTQVSGFEDVEILGCLVHDNGSSGMGTWTHMLHGNKNFYVADSVFHNNTGRAGITSPIGSGIVLGGVDTGLVERCVAHNNGANNNFSSGPVGIWTYDSTKITIQFCESYANKSNGADGGGFDLDGGTTNSVVQYCYSHDNYGAGYLVCCYSGASQMANNTVRYNISENDGRKGSYGGIMFFGAGSSDKVENCKIYHNTVYSGTETAVVSGTPAALRFLGSNFTGVQIWNNIFVTNGNARLITADSAMSTAVAQLQRNNYWSLGLFALKWGGTTYSTFSAWTSAAATQERRGVTLVGLNVNPQITSPGDGGIVGDPDLLPISLTAYQLTQTSPMIDSGLDLVDEFGVDPGGQDFYDTLIPQASGLDIGAHEHNPLQGILSANVTQALGNYDFTALGTQDWIVWAKMNLSSVDRKASGGNRISNWTPVGTGHSRTYNSVVSLSWTDGTPLASGTSPAYVRVGGDNNGFELTAAATSTLRTLKLYTITQYNGNGKLVVSLDDGSATSQQILVPGTSGLINPVFTIYFKSSSNSQLRVKWTNATATGNIGIRGAFLD